jgi:hypothetical protein
MHLREADRRIETDGDASPFLGLRRRVVRRAQGICPDGAGGREQTDDALHRACESGATLRLLRVSGDGAGAGGGGTGWMDEPSRMGPYRKRTKDTDTQRWSRDNNESGVLVNVE